MIAGGVLVSRGSRSRWTRFESRRWDVVGWSLQRRSVVVVVFEKLRRGFDENQGYKENFV